MNHITIITERGPDGTEYRKTIPYEPPFDPPRPYIIESLDGISVLVTPGQKTTYVQDRDGIAVRSDAPGKKAAGVQAVIYDGWRPLRDRIHATRMTEAEAFAFAKAQCWVLADNCPAGATATHHLVAI